MHIRASRLAFLLFLLALATFAESALAQSCGGSAGPPPAGGTGSEGSWLTKGQGSVRLSEEYEVKDRSYKGRGRVENDFSESLFISRTALDIRYGITDDWTADLTATYPHFTYRLKPPGGERTERKFRGPGDTFVSIGRRIMFGEHAPMPASPAPEGLNLPAIEPEPATRPLFLSLWAGVSLPTGQAEKPNPAFVTRDVSVANLQTGTGTYDPFFRARAEWPQAKWTPFAEFAVRYPVYENRYDYRTGDTEALVLGAEVPVVAKVSVSLAAMYQRTGRDTYQGDDVGVGGARWVYAIPAVAWQVTESVTLDAGVRVPVYRRTETKLSDSSIVYQVGLSLRF